MLDYCYSPEGFAEELKQQIQHFHHKAELILEGSTFFELANVILRAQANDKYFEILLLFPSGYRALEISNLMYRLVQGGARIGVLDLQSLGSETKEFALFDSKLMISPEFYPQEKNLYQLIPKKLLDFRYLMELSEQVYESSEQVKMQFWANKYFVEKGSKVELHWKIDNATFSTMNPGNIPIELVGNRSFLIEKDTLFTITSRNAKIKSTLTIFIKCLEEEPIQVSVFVFNKQLSEYFKLEPLAPFDGQYAVYEGDLLRLSWSCALSYRLIEKGLGHLKNIGNHNFIALENRTFEFQVSTPDGDFKKRVIIYPLSGNEKFSDLPDPMHEAVKGSQKSRRWMNKVKAWWLNFPRLINNLK